jgi:AcrR family transcriptional regulator
LVDFSGLTLQCKGDQSNIPYTVRLPRGTECHAGKKASQKREPLTKDRIVLKALELVEREGLDGFSFRKLADDLHCEAMSIYYHFPSKAHLFDAMVAQCLKRFVSLPDDAPVARPCAMASEFRRWPTGIQHFSVALYRMNSPAGMLENSGIFRRAVFPNRVPVFG